MNNKPDFKEVFPADFISEGVDQTRGWFFTLHAISTMIKGSVAFKNVISNGLVLDKNGNKMSKRLGNAVDPFSTIETFGSDPLRWYMMTNSSPWDNLKFDVEGVEEVRRKFFGTLYNTYSFFALYANVDGFTPAEKEIPLSERPEIDRWIVSLLNSLVKEVAEHYEHYEPTRAGRAIQDFVNDNLSNWYVRLNRKRFWGGEYDSDKIAAYQTLYTCLLTVAKLMAPIAPFYAERLWLDLNGSPKKRRVCTSTRLPQSRRRSDRPKPRSLYAVRSADIVDDTCTASQGRQKGKAAAAQSRCAYERCGDLRADKVRGRAHKDGGKHQKPRSAIARYGDGQCRQEDKTQLQDTRQALRQADERDSRCFRRLRQ